MRSYMRMAYFIASSFELVYDHNSHVTAWEKIVTWRIHSCQMWLPSIRIRYRTELGVRFAYKRDTP